MKNPTPWHDWNELAKSRIVFLSIVFAVVAFVLGSGAAAFPWSVLFAMVVGLALVGAGCGALNQYMERDVDALMRRTAARPLPTGRISARTALVFGIGSSIVGIAVTAVWVNVLTALLALATLVSYVLIYTPMKRRNSMSTLVGAIPGALPPLMGWTAARGAIELEGVVLFGVLFLWQIPHFLAIAWMYREDYGRAGFPLLSAVDRSGVLAARQALLYTAVLLPLTTIPTFTGLAGRYYFFGAIALGIIFLGFAAGLVRERSTQSARRLFFASLIYLPALGFLLCWDRVA